MRTTLTLDDALDRELRAMAARNGASYKAAVNQTLRAGLDALRRPTPARPYRIKPKSLGRMPGVDYDGLGRLADEMDDFHRVKATHAAD